MLIEPRTQVRLFKVVLISWIASREGPEGRSLSGKSHFSALYLPGLSPEPHKRVEKRQVWA